MDQDCKVYDNGAEIPFEYSSENDTLSFTLSKGWHSVGFLIYKRKRADQKFNEDV